MSLETLRPSPALKDFLPVEYKDLVDHGPYGSPKKVTDMGKFKEVLEEHPMCAGCAMSLFIRLIYIGMPNPEHSIVVGTAGCGRLALSQASVPFIYGNYGDTNAVASGLKRGLELRFPNQPKDVVVTAGDGGLVDIGFQGLMHSWFRHEKFTTILLDNAKVAKLDYIARVVPTNPARCARTIRRAILVAREFGSTYVQAYTSCNIEYSIPTPEVMKDAFEVEKDRYGFEEIISDRAKEYLKEIEAKEKQAKKANK
jgi:pyruvate ferredoxin oxidoreductase beta subunit